MKLYLRTGQAKLDAGFKDYICRKVHVAFAKVKNRIGSVAIVLKQDDSLHGLFNKQCQVVVTFDNQEKVVLTHTQSDYKAAVNIALRRVGRGVKKLIVKTAPSPKGIVYG
jgi:ribosome-associated translation inhibitor RaiA